MSEAPTRLRERPKGAAARKALAEQAQETEYDLLASLLGWRDSLAAVYGQVAEIVEVEDFAAPRARDLFRAAGWLYADGTVPDPATLKVAMRALGLVESHEVDLDIVGVTGYAPPPGAARRLAVEVRRLSLERRVAVLAEAYAAAGMRGDRPMMAMTLNDLAQAVAELRLTTTGEERGPAVSEIIWSEMWAREEVDHEWMVEPIVPLGRQVAIYSVAGTGKSLLLLEIAAAKATGRGVVDQAPAEPIDVVYVDMEMSRADLQGRLEALGYGPEDDLSHLHYYQAAGFNPFDTEEGGAELEWVVRQHGASLVVLDTMARAVEGDENDADTYRAFYRCTGSKLKALGVTLVRADHMGKDPSRGQRGSSAKADDVDLVWRLSVGDEGAVILDRQKHRMDWVPERVVLKRVDDPHLRHQPSPKMYPSGTIDCVRDLDELGVPLGESVRMAKRTLQAAGKGRRLEVLAAALRYRKERETPRETPPRETSGNGVGNGWEEPL